MLYLFMQNHEIKSVIYYIRFCLSFHHEEVPAKMEKLMRN